SFQLHTLQVAVGGLVAVTIYKLAFAGFAQGPGFAGLAGLLAHEWVILANLFGLLMGFALLSKHFEDSNVPVELPKILPDDWKGGFWLLVIVFVLSSFLDNIAAALIGGTLASPVFRGKVHIGYLAEIVAASNAGAKLEVPEVLDRFPVIEAAVWAAILESAPIRRPALSLMPSTFRGTIFLLALVATAAMMPVEKLPAASWQTALGLGFLSAVF